MGLVASIPMGLESARADGAAKRSDILPVSAIKRGMKGYGLTVFEGTKPERFDVEVIDVLDNFRPHQALILIKTRHPRLEVAKVVAGMSGSPIFINDKMVGAYAYGWTFGREPVAGVTPIENMLEDMARPLPKSIYGIPLKPSGEKRKQARRRYDGTRNRYSGLPGDYQLERHAQQVGRHNHTLVSAGSGLKPVSTPLLMGGMNPESVKWATELLSPLGLEPLQAGGGGKPDPNAPTRFVDGGAVGIELIRGDMSATGLGTVTRVEGDKLVAFGHPMMNAGVSSLPTAVGRILWFLASEMRSFKIGMPVRSVGALVNDRQSAIVVSHSAQAPVIPVTLKVKGAQGAPVTDWSFEVAHEKFMTPAFIAIALGNAMQATAAERQDVSWSAYAKLEIAGHGEVMLEDHGVSIGGTPEARDFAQSELVKLTGAVLNNPWEDGRIERADMEIALRYEREILRLRGAELLESEIDAGEPARIRLKLEPYAGKTITRVISVPIPRHLAGESVTISLAPGYTVARERAAPDNLAELIQNFENLYYPAKSVVAEFESGAGAISYRGRVAKNLPPGAINTIQSATSSIAPDSFGTEIRRVYPLSLFMTGRDSVTVKVRPVLN